MRDWRPTLPTLGPYRTRQLLGTGASARVYQAVGPSPDAAPVAIKVLHPHLADAPDFRRQFEREADTARELDHPGIVRVLAHGYAEGQPYLVMEYVPGPSLKDYLQEHDGPLAVEDAIALVAAVADALAYAHSQGVIHRDVKPSNILLREGRLDRPVLGDFGIARLMEATLDTTSGRTVGTPAYISPEQGQGRPADARSDVYALGALLFELVTGHPPFEAESPYALVLHHVHSPPPRPRDERPDLPPAVEAVILKALAKDPDDRYPTTAALASALRQSLAAGTRPAASRGRTWLPLAAAAAVLLVLSLLGLAWSQGWLPVEGSGAVAAPRTPIVESLVLQGRPAVTEAWLDPDLPERVANEDPKVHLQGPSTPDRIAYRLALPELPAGAEVLSATLSLYTVPWGEDNRYATVAAHRLLCDWQPESANYLSPWAVPGLQVDVDYQAQPFQALELDTLLHAEGWLEVDVTALVQDWLAGEPNHGLVLRLTDESYGMAHLWVYTGEYEDPNLRPRFGLTYRRP
jgi:hypothetical protein